MELERDDLIRGLMQLVASLRSRGEPAGIRIVGGAALALRYFERRTTVDIDAIIHPVGPTLAAAVEVAEINGWPADWLNNKAAQFVPIVHDEWVPLYDDDACGIWVASADVLLAMKLRASRPGRDDDDVANLLVICGVTTVAAAEEHFERYYLGEVLPKKAYRMLEAILSQGLPEMPIEPAAPDFS